MISCFFSGPMRSCNPPISGWEDASQEGLTCQVRRDQYAAPGAQCTLETLQLLRRPAAMTASGDPVSCRGATPPSCCVLAAKLCLLTDPRIPHATAWTRFCERAALPSPLRSWHSSAPAQQTSRGSSSRSWRAMSGFSLKTWGAETRWSRCASLPPRSRRRRQLLRASPPIARSGFPGAVPWTLRSIYLSTGTFYARTGM